MEIEEDCQGFSIFHPLPTLEFLILPLMPAWQWDPCRYSRSVLSLLDGDITGIILVGDNKILFAWANIKCEIAADASAPTFTIQDTSNGVRWLTLKKGSLF